MVHAGDEHTHSPVPDTPMRAAVLTPDLTVEVTRRLVPRPAPDEVLVRIASVGVCGSDVHYYRHGRIGEHVVNAPVVLGHECSGRVVSVGVDVDQARVGERVALEPQTPCRRCRECKHGRYNLCPNIRFFGTPPVDGAFCDYVTLPEDFAFPVPEEVDDDQAALLEPLSVAIAACRKGDVGPGSRVLIAGAGPVGVLTAQCARVFGASTVVVSDPVAERRLFAATHGATDVHEPGAAGEGDADVFVDASGVPSAVHAGLAALRRSGTAVLVGMGAEQVPLSVSPLQNRELWVTGVFRYAHTWPLAIELASRQRVDLTSLVTGRFGLTDVESALRATGEAGQLKPIVAPALDAP